MAPTPVDAEYADAIHSTEQPFQQGEGCQRHPVSWVPILPDFPRKPSCFSDTTSTSGSTIDCGSSASTFGSESTVYSYEQLPCSSTCSDLPLPCSSAKSDQRAIPFGTPQTRYRWMWADAKRTPFCWSRVQDAPEMVEHLRRARKNNCQRQVKLEIRCQNSSVVMTFASAVNALSHLNDAMSQATFLSSLVGPALDDVDWGRTWSDLGRSGMASPPLFFDRTLTIESTRWMWGDAGSRVCLSKRLAGKNHFRWSEAQSLESTISQLQQYRMAACARPVRMEIRRRGQPEIVMYPTVLAALCDLSNSGAPTLGSCQSIPLDSHQPTPF